MNKTSFSHIANQVYTDIDMRKSQLLNSCSNIGQTQEKQLHFEPNVYTT